jgi:hypothetical protein
MPRPTPNANAPGANAIAGSHEVTRRCRHSWPGYRRAWPSWKSREHSLVPADSPRAPSGRLQEAYLAVRAERAELAVVLRQIEAYAPGVMEKARAWVEQVDGTPPTAPMPSLPR